MGAPVRWAGPLGLVYGGGPEEASSSEAHCGNGWWTLVVQWRALGHNCPRNNCPSWAIEDGNWKKEDTPAQNRVVVGKGPWKAKAHGRQLAAMSAMLLVGWKGLQQMVCNEKGCLRKECRGRGEGERDPN